MARTTTAIGVLLVALLTIITLSAQRSQSRQSPAPKALARSGSAQIGRGRVLPVDMDEFVASSDMIIEGRVVSVTDVGDSTGWTDAGAVATVTPPSAANTPVFTVADTMPLKDIAVVVDTIYVNSTALPVLINDEIIIRGFGTTDGRCLEIVTAEPHDIDEVFMSGGADDRFLFGLVLNPDGTTWDVGYGVWGRFNLDGDEVLDTNCPPHPVRWAEHSDPAGFIAELNQAIGRQ